MSETTTETTYYADVRVVDVRGDAARVLSAQAWAREHLSLDRFGREWTGLICDCAPAATPLFSP